MLFAVDLHFADRQVHGESLAIAADRGHGAADADDLAIARSQVLADVAIMLRAIRIWHQHADVAAEYLRLGIAEHLLRGMVERLDLSTGVDHDDPVNRGINDRAPPCGRNPGYIGGRGRVRRIAHE